MLATHINDTGSASRQACPDELIIFPKVVGIQRATKLVVYKILPAHGESEDVHGVVFCEVGHLSCSRLVVSIRDSSPQSS
jgi:hypothetical protein